MEWLFYCPTTIKGVITIVHHSGHQLEAFISVFLSDVKVKTDNICSRFHIVPDPSFFLGSLSFLALPVLQNYHLTRTAVGQIAVFASRAVALIFVLESLRFELWFHFDWIEKINSDSIRCWEKYTHPSTHTDSAHRIAGLHVTDKRRRLEHDKTFKSAESKRQQTTILYFLSGFYKVLYSLFNNSAVQSDLDALILS